MGRSLSPLLRQELANLDKGADSRRSAMKALKSYAQHLDTKSIPRFLAEVSGPGGAPTGECTISLYEVLARVHGRNIVPQIQNIMSTIMRTLSSSGGSFALHQACAKVVPAIARYGIDPSTPEEEKTRIICSLCRPLSDALMGSQESAAAGAALCLEALVESGNWKFASDEMVNEVCLKVAGALEEKATQTSAHMSLVTSLVKHNGLIAEAYARSLVRSGLQILSAGVSEQNSQKRLSAIRLSAIQMINFLMKCVDQRSISSEVFRIVDAMEKCQSDDKMPFVRDAASEALQTAKALTGQKLSKHDIGSSPVTCSSSGRKSQRRPWRNVDNLDATSNGSITGLGSPESQTVDSCIKYYAFADSPSSVDMPSCDFEYSRRPNRRLWHDERGIVDVSLKDGLFLKACTGGNDSKDDFDCIADEEQIDDGEVQSEAFSGFLHGGETDLVTGTMTPSPQKTRSQLTIDDIKLYTSPRRLLRSLQNSTDQNTRSPEQQNDSRSLSNKVNFHSMVTSSRVSQPDNSDNKPNGKRDMGNEITLQKLNGTKEAELVQDDTESVSSTADLPENTMSKVSHQTKFEHKDDRMVKCKTGTRSRTAHLSFLWGILMILFAIIISMMRNHDEELLFEAVPT